MTGEPDLEPLSGTLHDLAVACTAKDPAARPTAPDVLLRLLGGNVPGDLLAQGASTAATLTPPTLQPPDTHTAPGAHTPARQYGPQNPPPPHGVQNPAQQHEAQSGPPPHGVQNLARQYENPAPPYGGVQNPAAQNAPQPYGVQDSARQHGVPYGGAGSYPVGATPLGGYGEQGTMPPYGAGSGGPARRGARTMLAVGAAAGGVLLVAGGITAAVLLSDRGKPAQASGENSRSPVASPSSTPAAAGGPCTYTSVPAGASIKRTGLPPTRPAVSGTVKATLATSGGDIQVQLDGSRTPCTVNSFVYLARSGFFDNTKCHRLTTDAQLKVLQCGDPSGTGTGGPSYKFADEDLAAATYTRGTVAMANAGPNTNGSQFFILYGDSSTLPKSYAVFGKVIGGLGVVDKIAAGGTTDSNGSGDGAPKIPLTITHVST